MNTFQTLDNVLKTADQLCKEDGTWHGDINEFIAASGSVCQDLSTKQVQDIHGELRNRSQFTQSSQVYFYNAGYRQLIYIKPIKE